MLPDLPLGVVDPRFPVIVAGVGWLVVVFRPVLLEEQILVVVRVLHVVVGGGGVLHARIVTETPGPVKRETK